MSKDESAFTVNVAPEGWMGTPDNGLTRREYFAALAMQGLCVPCIPGKENSNDTNESEYKAQMAVRLADALIKTLSKESNEK